jgi:hypothetical protein
VPSWNILPFSPVPLRQETVREGKLIRISRAIELLNAAVRKRVSAPGFERLRRSVSLAPGDPEVHCRLADMHAFRRDLVTAIGEYRTAIVLGKSDGDVMLSLARAYLRAGLTDLAVLTCDKVAMHEGGQLAAKALRLLDEAKKTPGKQLNGFNHNRYFRLKTLADHVRNLHGEAQITLLDVGGNDGALSLFLPQARYALADPAANGLSVDAFHPKSFDVVVACHVLEHVPQGSRTSFLEMLASRARRHVLLLNPFYDPEGHETERLKLILELTDAQWAKEHLECVLPHLDEVEKFAADHNYECKVYPNGCLPTTLAMVFLDHFAGASRTDMEKINMFYNSVLYDRLACSEFPTAYLVEIDLEN